MDLQAVVRRARRLDRAQAHEPADAVIDVHHEILGGKARHLGDKVLRPPRGAARPHQAIAQDVLLADHRHVGGLEPGLEPQHSERNLMLRQRHRLRPRGDRREVGEPVVAQHMLHAVA